MTGEPASWQVRLIPTRLGRVAVRRAGVGPTVAFWPSLMCDGLLFAHQAKALVPDHHIILIDPPGQGKSDPLTAPFALDESLGALFDILDALDISRATIAGTSWGGMLALLAAARSPDRVKAFIAMNAALRPGKTIQRFQSLIIAGLIEVLGIPRHFRRHAVSSFIGSTSIQSRPEVVAYVRRQLEAMDARSAAHLLRSLLAKRSDMREELRRISAPGLFLAGAEDQIFPMDWLIEESSLVTGSRLITLPCSGHLSALETPELTTATIVAFLSDQERRRNCDNLGDGE